GNTSMLERRCFLSNRLPPPFLVPPPCEVQNRASERCPTKGKDELVKAITARSARQRSSEYSDDFDSDEIVSLGDFSDTSADENSVKKNMNDFHISDDDEKNSPRLSFLKTKKSKSDVIKGELVSSIKNNEEVSPDGCEDTVVNSLSQPQNKNQEVEKEKMQVKPKPRILPIKSISSESNSLDTDAHFKPSPWPRSMLKKNSPGEDTVGEDKEIILDEELDTRSAPCSLPEAERGSSSEDLDPKVSTIAQPSNCVLEFRPFLDLIYSKKEIT
uniref:Microtubule associated protein 9 n=1 Tax=Loxodonta africana TaxID=9785 RepID=G3U7A7_LOXAF